MCDNTRHGIAQTLIGDNGPCFSSKEWPDLSVQYDFKHVSWSPEYAPSDGKAEKAVHILKRLLKKAADSKSDPYLALLNPRSSPLECGAAPAETRRNRTLRTTPPSCSKQNGRVEMKQRFKRLKEKQKFCRDRAAKHVRPLMMDDVWESEMMRTGARKPSSRKRSSEIWSGENRRWTDSQKKQRLRKSHKSRFKAILSLSRRHYLHRVQRMSVICTHTVKHQTVTQLHWEDLQDTSEKLRDSMCETSLKVRAMRKCLCLSLTLELRCYTECKLRHITE